MIDFGNYRLTAEDSYYSYQDKRPYYRLYEQRIDVFGNKSWTQVWAGRCTTGPDFTGVLAEQLFSHEKEQHGER